MHLSCLERLRCPFCGVALAIHEHPHTVLAGGRLQTGVLRCRCNAYPVVDGIPVLRPDDFVADARRQIEAGQATDALLALLNLSGDRATRFLERRAHAAAATYQELLDLLSPDLEGTYFLFRFSDPTFLVSEAVLGALTAVEAVARGPLLDMCGGSGHLTRTLVQAAPGADTWLADFEFWKLWLAQTFIVPEAHIVCCDGNHPLPFAADSFSLVLCSGAFEYIWPRRSFAGEMWRLAGRRGVVALTHTHNVLCENPSQGMPLAPAEYRALFEQTDARVYGERAVLDAALAGTAIDLATRPAEASLDAEPALIVLASDQPGVFRSHVPARAPATIARPGGQFVLNPLYRPLDGHPGRYRLTFPSPYYEDEFAECRRYLPDEIEWTGPAGLTTTDLGHLLARRVLLGVPRNYLGAGLVAGP